MNFLLYNPHILVLGWLKPKNQFCCPIDTSIAQIYTLSVNVMCNVSSFWCHREIVLTDRCSFGTFSFASMKWPFTGLQLIK